MLLSKNNDGRRRVVGLPADAPLPARIAKNYDGIHRTSVTTGLRPVEAERKLGRVVGLPADAAPPARIKRWRLRSRRALYLLLLTALSLPAQTQQQLRSENSERFHDLLRA